MKPFVIAAASASVVLGTFGAAIAGSFETGVAAFEKGDHEAALSLWSDLAAGGHQDAQFNLGIMYDQGIGAEAQPAEAVYWFEEAAQQGDVIAAFNLGLIYADGRGVDQDFAEAARWLGIAAEHEHPGAMEKLSFLYANGRGVEQDLRRAVLLTESAQEATCLVGTPESNHTVRLAADATGG